MAIYTQSILEATQERVGLVALEIRGRVLVNIEIDLYDTEGDLVKRNHRSITLEGNEAVEFWQNYSTDEYLEQFIIGESDAKSDTSYLPDGMTVEESEPVEEPVV